LATLVFEYEFEITVVLDDMNVELSVSSICLVRIFQFEIQFFCILLEITIVICVKDYKGR